MGLSYWEKNTWLSNLDVCIIGSGIVGLNIALQLKLKKPHLKILVLERGVLPSGASTKNAGFACFGSLSEIASDLSKMGESRVFDLIERRIKGLELLRKMLGDDSIDFIPCGGYELFTPEQKEQYHHCLELMEWINPLLKGITGVENTFSNSDSQIESFGFHGVDHLILNKAEGQIDTGKMMDTLIRRCISEGIFILGGIQIDGFTEKATEVELATSQLGNIFTKQLVIATNGFAADLLPGLEVAPARAQVLITSPLADNPISGTFHFDEGYYYFRNVQNRILLGGGRNMDFVNEQTSSQEVTELIQQRLDQILKEIILPGKKFTIEQRWAGTMGLGPVKEPIIQFVGQRTVGAVRMGGMGIALGSLVGMEAADLLLERQ